MSGGREEQVKSHRGSTGTNVDHLLHLQIGLQILKRRNESFLELQTASNTEQKQFSRKLEKIVINSKIEFSQAPSPSPRALSKGLSVDVFGLPGILHLGEWCSPCALAPTAAVPASGRGARSAAVIAASPRRGEWAGTGAEPDAGHASGRARVPGKGRGGRRAHLEGCRAGKSPLGRSRLAWRASSPPRARRASH